MTSEISEKPVMGKIRKIFWFLMRVLLAAAIIVWLIRTHHRDFLRALKEFNLLWLIPALVLYLVHLIVAAWRWHLLLGIQKININFEETFSLLMQGFFFSLVLPGGALGGDVVKAAFLASKTPKGAKLKGVFTILIDRVVGMIALFSVAGIIGLISYNFLKSLGGLMELVRYALVLGCIGGLLCAAMLFFHRRLEKIKPVFFLLALADKYSKGALYRLIDAMDDFRNSYKTLLWCILISAIFIHLNLGIVVYCLARGTGAANVSSELSILAASLGNVAGTIPGPPSGVGTRDIVIKGLLSAGKVAEGQAVAIPIIFTAIILFFNLAGGVFFVFSRKKIPEV